MHNSSMQTNYGSSDQAAQIITLAERQESKPIQQPFANSYEHLQALEDEAKLMVAVATFRHSRVPAEDDEFTSSIHFNFLPEGADLKLAQSLLEQASEINRIRENLSRQQGIALNFLEFCDKWQFDATERKIIQLLLMQFTSTSFFAVYESSRLERHCDNGMEIGAILALISRDLKEQLENRKYFSIRSTLIQNDLIRAQNEYMDCNTNFLRMSAYMYERYARYIVGDTNDYHAAFKFITQESSKVSLDQVVLPNDVKDDVVTYAEQYIKRRNSGTLEGLDDFFGYGTGLAFLFHGPSGTGKTMLANALADHLACPLLSFNVKHVESAKISYNEMLSILFREATLLGGIVFLDECDDIFGDDGNSHRSRSLLLEIEKSRCLTIMATNRPVDLDPAMERRIGMKVLFPMPDAALRRQMWNALLPPDIPLAPCVSLDDLAERFHFSGGLIKNSILMAITASGAVASGSISLTQQALIHAAELQTETMSDISRFCTVHKPKERLENLPLHYRYREHLYGLARACEWLSDQQIGLNLLLNCPDIPTGVRTAYALAAELDLTVRTFDFDRVISVTEDDKVIDMITQRRVNPVIGAFSSAVSDRSLVLFIDSAGDFGKNMDSADTKAAETIYHQFLSQVRRNNGLFCLVTKGIKEEYCPPEFSQYISISYPPEELQLEQWEKTLGKDTLSEEELITIVEDYPMHIAEIDFVVRQAKVNAIVNGRNKPGRDDIRPVLARYRTKTRAPVLFGR